MKFVASTPIQKRMVANIPNMTAGKGADKAKFKPENLNKFDADSVKLAGDDPRVTISAEDAAIHAKRNALQAKKNPVLMDLMTDPRAFKKKLEARFEAQKALTPNDPYSFEFGDYGVPVLEDLDAALGEEIEILKKKSGATLKGTGEKTGLMAAAGAVFSALNPFAHIRNKKLDTGIKYLNDLKKEVGGHLDKDSISYKRLNELSYFSARALGHFDREDLSFFDKNFLRVDRHLLGHKSASIDTEYARYKENDYRLFQKKAGDSGIRMAEDAFISAANNPDKFEMATLPVARSLGPGVFMQLLPHDIFLMGVSKEPEAADGFNRPGGDFYLHDARHASSIFAKRKLYEQTHNLSDAQKEKLEVKQSVWKKEMIAEKKKIESKELRYAIGFFSFNHHHDRGIPQLPSSFIPEEHGGVADWLYFALDKSGQPTGFEKPKETINEAYKWLRNFWLERLPQEEAILAASAPETNPAKT